MTRGYYDVDGSEISYEEWSRLSSNRRYSRIAHDALLGGVQVSTVWLGIDHSFGYSNRKMIFETMIFGGPHNDYQERYSTLEEAQQGHERALALVGSAKITTSSNLDKVSVSIPPLVEEEIESEIEYEWDL